MLTEKERSFLAYWEARRLKEKSPVYQVLTGLPVGLLFSVPIILILLSGRFWFKRADMVANSQLNAGVIFIAVFLIALFVAIFYKRRQWEEREEQYHKLKMREKDQP